MCSQVECDDIRASHQTLSNESERGRVDRQTDRERQTDLHVFLEKVCPLTHLSGRGLGSGPERKRKYVETV